MAAVSVTNDGDLRTSYRTCPLCEAGCGLEISLRGDDVVRIRGDRDDVFSHGYICPKGSTLKQLHEDPDRVRTPLVKRDGRFVEASWDEAFAEVERRLLADPRRARPRQRRRLPRQPERTQPRCAALRPLPDQGARHAATCSRPAPSTRRPKELSAGIDVRLAADHPGARPRPHRLPVHARRQSRTRRTAASPPRPIGPAGSRQCELVAVSSSSSIRVAAERPRKPTSTSPSGRAPTRFLLIAMVHTLVRRRPRRSRPARRHASTGLDEVERLAKDFTPEAVAAGDGDRRRHHPPPRARARCRADGRASTAASARRRRSSARSRQLARRRAQRAAPATSTGPAERCSRRRPPGRPTPAASRARGAAFASAGARAGCSGLPETLGELPVVAMAEEIETPGRRPDPCARDHRRQPGGVDAERRRTARRRARRRSTSWCRVDIYVNETTRHADVILPPPIRSRSPTTTWRCCSSACATSPTTRRRS